MEILWYWPFARPEELPLACATTRPGDRITVQVVDRPAAPTTSPCPEVELVRDLPDVRRDLVAWPERGPSRAATYVRRTQRRASLIRRTRPDICHLHYLNRFTDWAGPRLGATPLVISVHDVVPHDPRLPGRVENALLAATYRRADAVIVHHESLRHELVARFAVAESRVHVVPHQVFAYGTEPTPLPSQPRVLFFGTLRHNKGVEVLLRAIASTPDDIAFVIAGHGEPDIERRLAHAAAADRRIHLETGFVSQPRKVELFREATLVVLPYTSFASQSGVLHDAYAHGRPVLVSDVGALGDSVREDATGAVVPPRDVPALTRALIAVVKNRQALERFAANARALRAARSPERLGPTLRNIYDDLVAGRR